MPTKDAESLLNAEVPVNRRSSRRSLSRTSTLHRSIACGTLLASAFLLLASTPPVALNASEEDMDRSIKPGDDFYQYANGAWIAKATIPAGQSSFDTRAIMAERTSQRVRDLIQEAATSPTTAGARKVGDYYASFMDEDRIEATKLTPLADEMAAISGITSKTSLSAYLGTTLNGEIDGLVANSDHIFGLWINQGFEDTAHNVVHFQQGGLGMPDRDNYLDSSPKMAATRTQYQAHVAAVLKLAGVTDSEAKAAQILSLETRIAQAFAPDADAADVFKQNNPWKRTDFAVKAPGIDWNAYFKSAGLEHQSDFLVWQPSAVIGVSALVSSESIDLWKDYLRFHLFEQYADVLPKAVAAEHFAFYGTILSGAQQAPDRTKSAIAATNAALGQAVGQLYTQRYFPPEAKAKAQAMVRDIITAYRARISNLSWMSAPTKKKALDKLAALEIGIGYPDTWIDYSKLDVVPGDALGNMRRAEAFLRSRNLAKLNQPVDPVEWLINPQTPAAIIMFSPNVELFSAAIFQPPYFDANGDSASNYGSAGAGLAHEVSHSFDDLGNIYDAHGKLGDWWTAEDRAQYHAASAETGLAVRRLLPVSGSLRQGQAGSDREYCRSGRPVDRARRLPPVTEGPARYRRRRTNRGTAILSGLRPEMAESPDEDALRRQVISDTHPPGKYRSDSVRNIDAWYKAYGIAPGDKLYLKPEDRVRIW